MDAVLHPFKDIFLSWSFQVPLSQGTRPGRLASKKHELQRVCWDIMQDVFLLWYNLRLFLCITKNAVFLQISTISKVGFVVRTVTPTRWKPVCALQGVQHRRSTISTFCLYWRTVHLYSYACMYEMSVWAAQSNPWSSTLHQLIHILYNIV